jgi:hypothetical protein
VFSMIGNRPTPLKVRKMYDKVALPPRIPRG